MTDAPVTPTRCPPRTPSWSPWPAPPAPGPAPPRAPRSATRRPHLRRRHRRPAVAAGCRRSRSAWRWPSPPGSRGLEAAVVLTEADAVRRARTWRSSPTSAAPVWSSTAATRAGRCWRRRSPDRAHAVSAPPRLPAGPTTRGGGPSRRLETRSPCRGVCSGGSASVDAPDSWGSSGPAVRSPLADAGSVPRTPRDQPGAECDRCVPIAPAWDTVSTPRDAREPAGSPRTGKSSLAWPDSCS